jgi:hypothetical protein
MENIFSEKSYDDFLNDKNRYPTRDERIRPPDVSFLDAIMSPEADLTKTPEGRRVIEAIKAL